MTSINILVEETEKAYSLPLIEKEKSGDLESSLPAAIAPVEVTSISVFLTTGFVSLTVTSGAPVALNWSAQRWKSCHRELV